MWTELRERDREEHSQQTQQSHRESSQPSLMILPPQNRFLKNTSKTLSGDLTQLQPAVLRFLAVLVIFRP